MAGVPRRQSNRASCAKVSVMIGALMLVLLLIFLRMTTSAPAATDEGTGAAPNSVTPRTVNWTSGHRGWGASPAQDLETRKRKSSARQEERSSLVRPISIEQMITEVPLLSSEEKAPYHATPLADGARPRRQRHRRRKEKTATSLNRIVDDGHLDSSSWDQRQWFEFPLEEQLLGSGSSVGHLTQNYSSMAIIRRETEQALDTMMLEKDGKSHQMTLLFVGHSHAVEMGKALRRILHGTTPAPGRHTATAPKWHPWEGSGVHPMRYDDVTETTLSSSSRSTTHHQTTVKIRTSFDPYLTLQGQLQDGPRQKSRTQKGEENIHAGGITVLGHGLWDLAYRNTHPVEMYHRTCWVLEKLLDSSNPPQLIVVHLMHHLRAPSPTSKRSRVPCLREGRVQFYRQAIEMACVAVVSSRSAKKKTQTKIKVLDTAQWTRDHFKTQQAYPDRSGQNLHPQVVERIVHCWLSQEVVASSRSSKSSNDDSPSLCQSSPLLRHPGRGVTLPTSLQELDASLLGDADGAGSHSSSSSLGWAAMGKAHNQSNTTSKMAVAARHHLRPSCATHDAASSAWYHSSAISDSWRHERWGRTTTAAVGGGGFSTFAPKLAVFYDKSKYPANPIARAHLIEKLCSQVVVSATDDASAPNQGDEGGGVRGDVAVSNASRSVALIEESRVALMKRRMGAALECSALLGLDDQATGWAEPAPNAKLALKLYVLYQVGLRRQHSQQGDTQGIPDCLCQNQTHLWDSVHEILLNQVRGWKQLARIKYFIGKTCEEQLFAVKAKFIESTSVADSASTVKARAFSSLSLCAGIRFPNTAKDLQEHEVGRD